MLRFLQAGALHAVGATLSWAYLKGHVCSANRHTPTASSWTAAEIPEDFAAPPSPPLASDDVQPRLQCFWVLPPAHEQSPPFLSPSAPAPPAPSWPQDSPQHPPSPSPPPPKPPSPLRQDFLLGGGWATFYAQEEQAASVETDDGEADNDDFVEANISDEALLARLEQQLDGAADIELDPQVWQEVGQAHPQRHGEEDHSKLPAAFSFG